MFSDMQSQRTCRDINTNPPVGDFIWGWDALVLEWNGTCDSVHVLQQPYDHFNARSKRIYWAQMISADTITCSKLGLGGTNLFNFSPLQFVSKRHPDDVKEVVVWKRFSELKKLHGELSYTHRNLFRRQEEFPVFPRAQVFGGMCKSFLQT